MAKSTGYLNNPKLPMAGTRHNWTKQMVQDFAICSGDPVYFLKTHVKVIHLDRGEVPFEMYSYQEELALALQNGKKRIIMAAARQAGKTQAIAGMVLHYICFNPNKTVAVLAQKADQAKEILRRIQAMFESLPAHLKPGVKSWNKTSFELENGCIIFSAATGGSSVRGKSISLLVLDETAFVDSWGDFSASVLPTVSSSKESAMVFLSTPNGLNHFYDYVDGARKGTNGFHLIEAPWWKVPGRDEAWKKRALEELNHDLLRFGQEYELDFVGSSGTLISGSALKRLQKQNPVYQSDSGMYQYETPQEGRTYAICVDVSRGRGMDYSAFQVVDVTEMPMRQVMTFRNNLMSPTDYTNVINNVGRMYNEAFVLVEVNDIGGQVADLLHEDYEYENIIYTESAGRAGVRVSGGFSSNTVRGIRTTKTVKKIGCAILKLLIEQERLKIIDKHTIEELNTFSAKGDSYEAEDNKHDDMVMGLVLMAWLSQDRFFQEITDVNTMRLLREQTEEDIEESLTPFGFKRNGIDEFDEPFVDSAGDTWALNGNSVRW